MIVFSENNILEYLGTMHNKNLIPANTVAAQKAAIIKVLSVLDETEKITYTQNLIQILCSSDLITKQSLNFLPESLKTYGGRFLTAFRGYIEWSSDPSGYRPTVKRGRRSLNAKPIKENGLLKQSQNTRMRRQIAQSCLLTVHQLLGTLL